LKSVRVSIAQRFTAMKIIGPDVPTENRRLRILRCLIQPRCRLQQYVHPWTDAPIQSC